MHSQTADNLTAQIGDRLFNSHLRSFNLMKPEQMLKWTNFPLMDSNNKKMADTSKDSTI